MDAYHTYLGPSPIITLCPSLASSSPWWTANVSALMLFGTVWFAKETTIGLTESFGAHRSTTSLLLDEDDDDDDCGFRFSGPPLLLSARLVPVALPGALSRRLFFLPCS